MKKHTVALVLFLMCASVCWAQTMVKTNEDYVTVFSSASLLVRAIAQGLDDDSIRQALRNRTIVPLPRGTSCKIISGDKTIVELQIPGLPGTWFSPAEKFSNER